VADSLLGPLDESTLGMLQSLPDLPPTMSAPIEFRLVDRMLRLVPAVDAHARIRLSVGELASTAASDATEPT